MQERGRYICSTPDDISCVQNIASSNEIDCDGRHPCVIAPSEATLPEPIESLRMYDNCGFSIDVKPGMKKFTLAGVGESSGGEGAGEEGKPNKNLVCTIRRSSRRENKESSLECHRDGAFVNPSDRRSVFVLPADCSGICDFSVTPADSIQCDKSGCSIVIGNPMNMKPVYNLSANPNVAFMLDYNDVENGINSVLINIDTIEPNDINLRGNLDCKYSDRGFLGCTIVPGECPKQSKSKAEQSSPKKQRKK